MREFGFFFFFKMAVAVSSTYSMSVIMYKRLVRVSPYVFLLCARRVTENCQQLNLCI